MNFSTLNSTNLGKNQVIIRIYKFPSIFDKIISNDGGDTN